MTCQSSDAQQYCGTQFLEATDDRRYCAAQLDVARKCAPAICIDRQAVHAGTAGTRNISAYAEIPGSGWLAAGDGHVEEVAADVVTAVCRCRI
jgi:hypothetical protein